MLRRALLGFVFCLLSGTLVAQAGQFLVAPQYATGTNPQAVAVGDFNGDGILDVAVVGAGPTSNSVSVLLGKSTGGFAAKVDYAVGNAPEGVAIADFRGVGKLDLAVTNSKNNTVSILLGNGDGTFQKAVNYLTGKQPQGIAIADLNGDTIPDIVVTDVLDGNVSVLLGKGDGTFKPQVAYTSGGNPMAVAVGDMNGDGFPDLVVANETDSDVSVLLGNGTGTFGSPTTYTVPTGGSPVSVALADFNNDGHLDIAVADQLGNGQGSTVSVLLFDTKTNGFDASVEYYTASTPTGVIAGDFDNDGNQDLAVSASVGNTISILWGKGDGTFVGQVNAGTGDTPNAVAAGDFNKDGTLDLVSANSGDNTVTVVLNNGNRTFQARADYPAGTDPYSIVAKDFNGDGALDLAVANTGLASQVSILMGNGNGTFQGPNHYATGDAKNPGSNPYALAVGDFNGDGVFDLGVANYGSNSAGVMLGIGAGGLGTGEFSLNANLGVGTNPESVAVLDLNGDSNDDMVLANFASNNVSVLLGNGDGTFQTAVVYPVGAGPVAVAIADVNGDQIPDLIVVNQADDTISILLGNGDGTFQAQKINKTPTKGSADAVAVGDFNGDNIPDLAIADFALQKVAILLGKGDGTFPTIATFNTVASPSSVAIGDFNGDGKLDLALSSTPTGTSPGNLVSLLLGNGNGTFQAPTLYGVGSFAYSAVVGDFNNDGALDVAVANGAAGTVSVLLNVKGTNLNVESNLANPSAYGQVATFTINLAASVPNGIAPAPSGTVTLKNGNTVLGSQAASAAPILITTGALPVGVNHLSVVYSGDTNYLTHTITYQQTVNKAGTQTAVVSSANPTLPNVPITLTATVASNTQDGGVPTGTVTFLNGAAPLGSATLTAVSGNGVATLPVTLAATGSYTITASYAGNGTLTASSSQLSLTVGQVGSTTTLNAPASANLNQSVTLSATVAPPAGITVTPTGKVTFLDGSTQIGSPATLSNGVATMSISTLTAGTHTINANYSGDVDFTASTSTASVNVIGPGFSLAASALSASTVAPGSSATATITITTVGGLAPTAVTFTCNVTGGGTPAPTCSLGAISGSTSTLTIATTGPSASLATPAGQRGSGTLFAFSLIVPAMLLGGAGLNKPNRRKLLGFCFIFLVLSGCLFQAACGSSSSSSHTTPPPTSGGTPAGTYTVTVTGNASGTQHALPITLTVN